MYLEYENILTDVSLDMEIPLNFGIHPDPGRRRSALSEFVRYG